MPSGSELVARVNRNFAILPLENEGVGLSNDVVAEFVSARRFIRAVSCGALALECSQFLTLETGSVPDSIGRDAFSEVKQVKSRFHLLGVV